MAITLEQLQDKHEARNVAQWEWRVLDREAHYAGNSPILNLRFERVIKTVRNYNGFTKARSHALLKNRTPGSRKIRQIRAKNGTKQCYSPILREILKNTSRG